MLYCPHFRKMLIGNKNIAIDSTIKNVFRIICVLILFFFEAVPCEGVQNWLQLIFFAKLIK
jgi:hypothetical protein